MVWHGGPGFFELIQDVGAFDVVQQDWLAGHGIENTWSLNVSSDGLKSGVGGSDCFNYGIDCSVLATQGKDVFRALPEASRFGFCGLHGLVPLVPVGEFVFVIGEVFLEPGFAGHSAVVVEVFGLDPWGFEDAGRGFDIKHHAGLVSGAFVPPNYGPGLQVEGGLAIGEVVARSDGVAGCEAHEGVPVVEGGFEEDAGPFVAVFVDQGGPHAVVGGDLVPTLGKLDGLEEAIRAFAEDFDADFGEVLVLITLVFLAVVLNPHRQLGSFRLFELARFFLALDAAGG